MGQKADSFLSVWQHTLSSIHTALFTMVNYAVSQLSAPWKEENQMAREELVAHLNTPAIAGDLVQEI